MGKGDTMTYPPLPEEYQGFPTQELLDMWEAIPSGKLRREDFPVAKIRAMRDLVMEYEISPIAQTMREMGQPHPLSLKHKPL